MFCKFAININLQLIKHQHVEWKRGDFNKFK